MVGARIKALLIPYLIWSTAVLVARAMEGHVYPLSEYLTTFLTGTANPAYYYIILLCQFYLISPFLVPLARRHWKLLLVVAAIAQTAVQIQQYPAFLGWNSEMVQPFVDVIPKWLFPARLFWFSFGVVAGFHLQELKAWVTRWRWQLLVTLIISFCIGIPEWELYFRLSGLDWLSHRETLIDTVYSAAFLLCFIAFDKLSLPFPKQLGELGAKSFGIYLVHSPVMEYTARAVYHLAPWILLHQILMQPILVVVGLAIPLIAMEMVARSPARRFYSYLFGK
jgi:peptidoglycan/LPS O-acetylase OafA/YrhL